MPGKPPFVLQVEVKVVPVDPSSAAGAALRRAIDARAGGAAPPGRRLRPHVGHRVPMAFELRAESVCLWGLDLPALLPNTAALPRPRTLLLLEEDVAAARSAATADGAPFADQGGSARRAR